ncbi:MAG: B12-binding domain-containing radical SAM protein [Candidatus Omnitrophica bacterium]|nr:B12-binding domain-containing radical SAM protein [Candidatus Omnitrophota bacterium]
MNILFVVKTFSIVEPMGIMQISASVKSQGHKSFVASIDADDILARIQEKEIDVVALSMLSTETKTFNELAQQIKGANPKVVIVAGGPHPTYFPQIVDEWPIDGVVVGEGDLVFGEIMKAVENGESLDAIPNVHTKTCKNPVRPLVPDLDNLPWADRELVADVTPLKYVRMKSFFATRGCPFACAYCFNSAYNQMYHGKGKILRRRSVESLICEIEQVKEKYPMDFVRFGDDAFIFKHDEWVEEFVDKYSSRIGLPFYFLINPNCVTEKLVKRLKEAKCYSAMMGIECGNYQVRKDVLKRNVTNDTMLNVFKIFRDYDIKVFSNTILGLPGSTLEDDLESLDFTLQCRPYYSGFTVMTPFPGTDLYKYCEENDYLEEVAAMEDSFPQSMQQDSCLKGISEERKNIHRNILMLGPVANAFPFLKKWIVSKLIYGKPNVFFNAVGSLVRNYQNMKVWPFRKSPGSFWNIFWQVMRIDKKNYIKEK